MQDCLLLDQSGLLLHLRHSRQERQIECNMHTAARFHMRTPAVSLCYGELLTDPQLIPARFFTADKPLALSPFHILLQPCVIATRQSQ